MKKLFFLILFLPLFAFSQEYSEVVEVPGKNIDQLYATAREWFAETFNSANNVLQMDDPVAGKLIGKGSTHISESYIAGGIVKVPITMDWYPNFTIKVSIKDGKYKCDITDITIKTSNELLGPMEQPFGTYLNNKDYYKNARDPEWLINNPPQGTKVNKSQAKGAAQALQANYNLICKTEIELNSILVKLQKKMKSTEDNW